MPNEKACTCCTSRSRDLRLHSSPANISHDVCTRLSAASTFNRQHLQLHTRARTRASRRSFGYSAASTRVSELTCASPIFWLQLRWLSLFSANLSGLHTDLTYNVNNWVGLEGNVVSAFGSDVFGGEMSKYVLYTVGARINAGPSRRRITPWGHALVGGAHLNPQVAGESKNGFALQLGGGADWSYNPRVSIRAEADYVRTQLYSSSQNNFQVGIGAVIHF
ncbi:MAG: hypothetical protein DMG34_07025 [Acidobacteria bacterium]|nr:MAG: hypothetical protein DMG34_07025 [Acidobacteriota bacterium]